MKIKIDTSEFNRALEELSKEYKIFAPTVMPFKGTYSDTDLISYSEIERFDEIEFERKSNYSSKETILPINQILFYFTEDQYKESSTEDKKLLVFMRSCDIHGVKRIDQIYLNNGNEEDYFYKRIRDKVKFVLIGCKESFRNCFCASMGSNKTEDYSIGMNLEDDFIYMDIKDKDLEVFNGEKVDFEIDFVKENKISIEVPQKIDVEAIKSDSLWEEYDKRCIGCGRCNFVCPTCTCFTMQDIFYKENQNAGERRRVWASCQVEGYTDIAGGHSFRTGQGDRMRFKVLHKISDFKSRFGYNMCVGCGRCDDACPEYISFSSCVEKIDKFEKERGGK
ncbi:anaerobic sulfite reductase subunit AsrA [Metaclostridioides mangenotii]|uniref:Anaerobic sulfite reductase subunit A n=1 Tax=Metaclostridioides mangenotii TaxID=1540 RepID=A0ABS4E7A1_9FIRM|nr:anaerobic sulfite reductase subunit AsrA [Clostridioides mangenotii]MBP1853825.1 anaerobic sulfite reductase subunit A [Clostridioides mangenotii]